MDFNTEYLKMYNSEKYNKILKNDNYFRNKDGYLASKKREDYDFKGELKPHPEFYDQYKQRKESISEIQTTLNEIGMRDNENKPLKVDSVFGPKTRTAVA